MAEMEADIARFRRAAGAAPPSPPTAPDGPMESVKAGVDTFLLYDFFVICFILFWLVLAVVVRLGSGFGFEVGDKIPPALGPTVLKEREHRLSI